MDLDQQDQNGFQQEDKVVINYMSLNQEQKCIAIGTNKGYAIYSLENLRNMQNYD